MRKRAEINGSDIIIPRDESTSRVLALNVLEVLGQHQQSEQVCEIADK